MSDFNDEWAMQVAHQAMKAWMQDHGWSTLGSADPAELLSFIEQNGDDSDFETFESNQTED